MYTIRFNAEKKIGLAYDPPIRKPLSSFTGKSKEDKKQQENKPT